MWGLGTVNDEDLCCLSKPGWNEYTYKAGNSGKNVFAALVNRGLQWKR